MDAEKLCCLRQRQYHSLRIHTLPSQQRVMVIGAPLPSPSKNDSCACWRTGNSAVKCSLVLLCGLGTLGSYRLLLRLLALGEYFLISRLLNRNQERDRLLTRTDRVQCSIVYGLQLGGNPRPELFPPLLHRVLHPLSSVLDNPLL